MADPRVAGGLLFFVAVAAVLERAYAKFPVAAQAKLMGGVVIQFDEARRTVVAVAAGKIPAVIDMIEGNVAVVGFESIGCFGDSRKGSDCQR